MKHIAQSLIVALLLPGLCRGAWSLSDKVSGGATGASSGSSPLTNNATIHSYLVIGMSAQSSTLTNRSVTSVKYGGTSLVQVARNETNGNNQATVWVLPGPPTGSNNVTWTTGGNSTVTAFGASTWQGGKYGTLLDSSSASSQVSATVHSLTNTVQNQNCVMIDFLLKDFTTGTQTDGAGQTTLFNAVVGTSFWADQSYKIGAVAGTTNIFTHTFSITSPCSMTSIALPPDVPENLPTMGVGQ